MQLGWLIRRISRIYPAEIPYRISGVVRAILHKRGWFDASRPPQMASDSKYGLTWVAVPDSGVQIAEPLIAVAEEVLRDGLKLFDITLKLTNEIPFWNRDPKTGTNIPITFGPAIDFRHLDGDVDIKYLWELNRHVWWVWIAQAYAVTGQQRFIDSLAVLLDSWLRECPYQKGANWSSPVEHGIRLINWSIVWHLIGGSESAMFATKTGAQLRERWMISIYQHIRFASDNYSRYSSADNHLIGEAAGLFVAAHTWDLWDEARGLRRQAKQILEAEILKQFTPDGVNNEQAICYHKFSLEFLLAAMLAGEANDDHFSTSFKSRMRSAIEFLAAMMDCDGNIAQIGDSDDGRVFEFASASYMSAYEFMLAAGGAVLDSPIASNKLTALGRTVPVATPWLRISKAADQRVGQPIANDIPTMFQKGGYLIVGAHLHEPTEFRLTMDIGALGSNKIAGHGHADALAMLLSFKGHAFLIDPGTYCYNAAPEMRHYFRGTSAHNTITIDDCDQSIYGGSFLWLRDVHCKLNSYMDDGAFVVLEASHNGYLRLKDPVRHIRKVNFCRKTLTVVVEDRFECKKPHACALNWHFAPDCHIETGETGWIAKIGNATMEITVLHDDLETTIVAGQDRPPAGWYSDRFYRRQPTPMMTSKGVIKAATVLTTTFRVAPQCPRAKTAPN